MRLSVTVPPPVEPVTLAEIYAHLRLDTTGSPPTNPDDALLQSQIQAAREHVENCTRRAVIQQTLVYRLPYFPTDRLFFLPRRFYDDTLSDQVKPFYIELPKSSPFIGMGDPATSPDTPGVQYYDENNTLRTLDPATYQVSSDAEPARIDLVWGETWPITYERTDAVIITYQAGYAPYTGGSPVATDYRKNVPQSIKNAIKLRVQQLYDPMTPDKYKQLESAIDSMLYSYKVYTFEYGSSNQ